MSHFKIGESKVIESRESQDGTMIRRRRVSLDGKRYFYTEALRRTANFPYTMRWPKERQRYISCFCCPPNTLRTLCEAQEYAYAQSADTLWVNLFGQNTLSTKDLEVEQTTNYPWDGKVTLTVKRAKNMSTMMVHIPGWADGATIDGNQVTAGSYVPVTRKWKKGDVITIDMPMRVRLMEANPLVEEAKNQVAVMRGPLVYCLESNDTEGIDINDIIIPAGIQFKEVPMTIDGHTFVALEGEAYGELHEKWNNDKLYQEVSPMPMLKANIRLIPYYAWDNRGKTDMTVWMNVSK